MSQIYETVRKIIGRCKRKNYFLFNNGRYFTTVPEIANILAKTFRDTSSPDNYFNQFRVIKDNTEARPVDFSYKNKEYYNSPFSIHELEMSLSRTKNSAPGPDGIHYQMIKYIYLKL